MDRMPLSGHVAHQLAMLNCRELLVLEIPVLAFDPALGCGSGSSKLRAGNANYAAESIS